MNWIELTSISQVDSITEEHLTSTIVIFKHSTRCSISSMALSRLEKSWDESKSPINTYFLDLIQFRDVSNYIAEKFSIHHQSPQILLIKNGECTYEESHMGIRYDELVEQLVN